MNALMILVIAALAVGLLIVAIGSAFGGISTGSHETEEERRRRSGHDSSGCAEGAGGVDFTSPATTDTESKPGFWSSLFDGSSSSHSDGCDGGGCDSGCGAGDGGGGGGD